MEDAETQGLRETPLGGEGPSPAKPDRTSEDRGAPCAAHRLASPGGSKVGLGTGCGSRRANGRFLPQP